MYDNSIYIFNIIAGIAGIILCIAAVAITNAYSRSGRLYNKEVNTWIPIFECCIGADLSDLVSYLTLGNPAAWAKNVQIISDYALFILDFGLVLLLTRILIKWVGESRQTTIWFRCCLVMFGIFVLFLVANVFTGCVFRLDEMNLYYRGPWHPVTQILGILVQLGDMVLLHRNRKKMKHSVYVVFMLFILVPMVALIIQALVYGISLVHMASSLMLILIYLVILNYVTQVIVEQEKKLDEARIDSMLSQMQPHFLYNSLTAIMAVEENPPETRKAISYFAKYLRSNLDSIRNPSPIPFDKEYKHIQTYLNLEKVRYGDRLEVQYEVETTDFVVPPRSIQLLVEYAVQKGLAPHGGGKVALQVRKGIGEYWITVGDDGSGFPEGSKDDGSNKVLLNLRHVREQLFQMAGGRMDIRTSEKGTRITIMIPMDEKLI